MRSKKVEGTTSYPYKALEGPKTPHEETMNCVESTNAIVSKILEIMEKKEKRYQKWLKKVGWKDDTL